VFWREPAARWQYLQCELLYSLFQQRDGRYQLMCGATTAGCRKQCALHCCSMRHRDSVRCDVLSSSQSQQGRVRSFSYTRTFSTRLSSFITDRQSPAHRLLHKSAQQLLAQGALASAGNAHTRTIGDPVGHTPCTPTSSGPDYIQSFANAKEQHPAAQHCHSAGNNPNFTENQILYTPARYPQELSA
jgi:hypothetical protein